MFSDANSYTNAVPLYPAAGTRSVSKVPRATSTRGRSATGTRSRKASTSLGKSCINVALGYFGFAAAGAVVIWAWHSLATLFGAPAASDLVSLVSAHVGLVGLGVGGVVLLTLALNAPVFPAKPAMGMTHDQKLSRSMDRGFGGSLLIMAAVGLMFLALATGTIHLSPEGPLTHLIDRTVFGGAPTQVEAPAPQALPQSASFNSIVGR